jgi:hypothetical protein
MYVDIRLFSHRYNQKMKQLIWIASILLVFWWMNTATSKYGVPFVCQGPISHYLNQDTIVRSYYYTNSRDSIIIMAFKDSLWDKKMNDLCRILRDSCTRKAYSIIVLDTTTDLNLYNTQYGRMIHSQRCP